jgi:hypothetical protein
MLGGIPLGGLLSDTVDSCMRMMLFLSLVAIRRKRKSASNEWSLIRCLLRVRCLSSSSTVIV